MDSQFSTSISPPSHEEKMEQGSKMPPSHFPATYIWMKMFTIQIQFLVLEKWLFENYYFFHLFSDSRIVFILQAIWWTFTALNILWPGILLYIVLVSAENFK